MGIFVLFHRSQVHINENKDILAARQDERKFFSDHRDYSSIANIGTDYLSHKLNTVW